MGASHGATGWVCKAVHGEADLVRRRSARGAVHREIVGAVQGGFINLRSKGLTVEQLSYERALIADVSTLARHNRSHHLSS